MPFKSDKQRKAAFANMNTSDKLMNVSKQMMRDKYERGDVSVVINTDKEYADYLKPHLEEEHPKTKGNISVIDANEPISKIKDIIEGKHFKEIHGGHYYKTEKWRMDRIANDLGFGKGFIPNNEIRVSLGQIPYAEFVYNKVIRTKSGKNVLLVLLSSITKTGSAREKGDDAVRFIALDTSKGDVFRNRAGYPVVQKGNNKILRIGNIEKNLVNKCSELERLIENTE